MRPPKDGGRFIRKTAVSEDRHAIHDPPDRWGSRHEWVHHAEESYVANGTHTNVIEDFWYPLERGIGGSIAAGILRALARLRG